MTADHCGAPVPTPTVHVGVDVGGTRTKVTALGADGVTLAVRTVPTAPGLATDIGEFVAALVADVATEPPVQAAGGVRACGVVVPGIVDEAKGVGIYAANLGWRDLDIRTAVGLATGLPVAVGHDVRAGLVAEARFGAVAGAEDALFMPIGTGIAAAMMVEGRLLTARGWAGEIGHAVVRPGGPLCGCGARGCFEAVASAAAIARTYAGLSGRTVTGADVAALVESGDVVAGRVWADAVDVVAEVVSLIAAATGIRLVVIGGGLANAGATLLDPLTAALEFRRSIVAPPTVVRAALGDRAGSLGAAILAESAGAPAPEVRRGRADGGSTDGAAGAVSGSAAVPDPLSRRP